ncbi:carbohydrate ABC transporter membrane protein 2 (CUT1 family) [Neobacillus bataviensis]|uniref:Carbohydrate ABC transporter membrane protein 2 (CUT1 family) n=1 Tax=Neobacillus bataviensis TaxID=220685 RepID=A0A561E0F0_9BACI|nr:carbohydrate ABC transporter permease [Neobacillus bataviensis]TWE09116.1 carbohydrate ABC transporter membrane protein 2 (CUT1 family) [Neobacillus bataviensis]
MYQQRRLLTPFLLYAFLIILVVIFLIPIVFIAATSLKSNSELVSNSWLTLPKHYNWQNYLNAWTQIKPYFMNSLIISLVKVPIGIVVEALAAYALTRMALKRSNLIFAFFLVGMMVPMQATLVPLNIILSRLHLTNTYLGIMIIYIGFGVPFGILILRGFFRTIPTALDEAAVIDGCGDWMKFIKIILPLSLPALATLMILDFISTWNEFVLAQIFISDDSMRTVTTGLLSFQGEHNTDYTLLNAGVMISVIPQLIIYLIFQKYFVSGMAGSVKG